MRPVVFRTEYGRLGNQLFQYSALRSLDPRPLVLVGFSELFEAFSNISALRLPEAARPFVLRLLGEPKGAMSARIRQRIHAIDEDSRSGRLSYSPGGRVYISRPEVFSQVGLPEYIDHGLRLTFRPSVVDRAERFLVAAGTEPQRFLIVHARGSDYAKWPSEQFPALLPVDWIVRQVTRLRKADPEPPIVIVGDDDELKTEIQGRIGGVVSHEDPAVDLALFSLALGGVLSASSFSWWGSALASSRAGVERPFIAPMFWAGHRKREWYPPGMELSPHLLFQPVE
jgi:hypothetical protein